MSTPEADLLKVAADAGVDEIKQAYRKAALAHHPDQNPHPEAARHFRRLTEAYRRLEAKARAAHPVPPKKIRLEDRVAFVLADLRTLVRRWPADRWDFVVDGLPAGVWLVSVLDVLARAWPTLALPRSASPTLEHVEDSLSALESQIKAQPLPGPVAKTLGAAVHSAELRLKALERAAGSFQRKAL